MSQLDGTWDGQDSLSVSTSPIRIDADGGATYSTSTDTRTGITTSDPPTVHFDMRRTDKAGYAGTC